MSNIFNPEVVSYTGQSVSLKHDIFKYPVKISDRDIKKYYAEFGRLPPSRKEVYENQYR